MACMIGSVSDGKYFPNLKGYAHFLGMTTQDLQRKSHLVMDGHYPFIPTICQLLARNGVIL